MIVHHWDVSGMWFDAGFPHRGSTPALRRIFLAFGKPCSVGSGQSGRVLGWPCAIETNDMAEEVCGICRGWKHMQSHTQGAHYLVPADIRQHTYEQWKALPILLGSLAMHGLQLKLEAPHSVDCLTCAQTRWPSDLYALLHTSPASHTTCAIPPTPPIAPIASHMFGSVCRLSSALH